MSASQHSPEKTSASGPQASLPREAADTTPANGVARREFLRSVATGAAAGMAFSIVPRHVLGGKGFVAPSEKINVAMIGCGGRARGNLQGVMQHDDAQVIAVADPATESDSTQLRIYRSVNGRLPFKSTIESFYEKKTPNHGCAEYEDFREMLDKEKSIDAVVISTPDHQHAHGAVHSMRLGKHCYCEKPLTHNIREARLVAKVAQETGVATQLGNQGHSRETMAQTIELVRGNAIGEIKEVHSWVSARRWNPELMAPPTDTQPVPKGLNWDLWVGPREMRPFHPAYVPVHWRDFWEFGCGALGDFGCHDLDSPTWALNLYAPSIVHAHTAGNFHPELAPHGSICYFHFPKSGDQPELKVTWYDGGLMPELPEGVEPVRNKYGRGVMFVGSEGYLLCEGAGGTPRMIRGGELIEKPELPTPSIPRVRDHYRDWLDACKGGRPALSNFEYGARLTEITLLGVLAVRTGKRLHWNHEEMRVDNLSDATPIIEGTYRKGWEVV